MEEEDVCMNFTQIAKKLGISRQAVQQSYHRALIKLSKIPEVRERALDLGIPVDENRIAQAHLATAGRKKL
jgi:DNA-directed RNA polymerase specialized sigma24 family protein